MASIRKTSSGWQVQLRRKGYPSTTKSFTFKADAQQWAREAEAEMQRGFFKDTSVLERTTLKELLKRYLQDIAPNKRGSEAESYRLKRLINDQLSSCSLKALDGPRVAEYRDRRLREVSSSSVRRELVILSHVLTVASREWGYPLPANPVQLIKRPTESASRSRRLEAEEEAIILKACSEHPNPWLKPLVILAIETAMRRSEMLGLRWSDVDLQERTALIRESKNGEQRTVPLSRRAVEVLTNLPRSIDGRVIPILPDTVTKAWGRITTKLGINNLRFHDLRHEATTRLFEKGLHPMEVSVITGHKDLQMLKRYTHIRASSLLERIG